MWGKTRILMYLFSTNVGYFEQLNKLYAEFIQLEIKIIFNKVYSYKKCKNISSVKISLLTFCLNYIVMLSFTLI